jgi:hypothetical protein
MTPEQKRKILDFVDKKLGSFQAGAWYQFIAHHRRPLRIPADHLKSIGHRELRFTKHEPLDLVPVDGKPVFVLESEVVIINQIGSKNAAIKVLCDENVFYIPLGSILIEFWAAGGTPAEEALMILKFDHYVSVELCEEDEK